MIDHSARSKKRDATQAVNQHISAEIFLLIFALSEFLCYWASFINLRERSVFRTVFIRIFSVRTVLYKCSCIGQVMWACNLYFYSSLLVLRSIGGFRYLDRVFAALYFESSLGRYARALFRCLDLLLKNFYE